MRLGIISTYFTDHDIREEKLILIKKNSYNENKWSREAFRESEIQPLLYKINFSLKENCNVM